MKNRIIPLVVGIVLLLCCLLLGDPSSEPAYPHKEMQCMWFDSLNVRFIGNWPFGSSLAVAYDLVRSLAFCGSGGGVYILDLSVPSAPVKLSELIKTRGIVYGLSYEPSDSMLYIADGTAGIEIWDASNPSLPTIVGSYDTPGIAYGVAVSGSCAYVADWNSGLRVIDVSTPSNPTEVGYCDTPGHALDVAVSGSCAYVADEDAGLRVIDVSTPSNPTEVGYCDTPGWAEGVAVSGSYAYVADDYSGLRVIDVSTPSNPTEVGYYDTPNRDRGIAVSDPYAYVANGYAGLQVYENLLLGIEEITTKTPTSAIKMKISPNPFTTVTTISLSGMGHGAGGMELTIYDSAGRLIKSVKLATSTYQLGADLVPGVYFLKATIGEYKEVQKLIKIR